MSNTLKPCPFCGGFPLDPMNYGDIFWFTECVNCPAGMRCYIKPPMTLADIKQGRAKLIRKWNRRKGQTNEKTSDNQNN